MIHTMNSIAESVSAITTEEQTSVIESLSVDIIVINTLNHDGVRNLQVRLGVCTEMG